MRFSLSRRTLSRRSTARAGRILAAAGLAAGLAACTTATTGRTEKPRAVTLAASLEGYQADPALLTAPKPKLVEKVANACMVVQARTQNVPRATIEKPCGCYAERTLASLDEGELQSYRSKGYFNESAKAKALEALDACSLPRPA